MIQYPSLEIGASFGVVRLRLIGQGPHYDGRSVLVSLDQF